MEATAVSGSASPGSNGVRSSRPEGSLRGEHDSLAPGLPLPGEHSRALVERLPLIVYVDRLDERASNVYTSPQTARILGYEPEEWREHPDLFVEILHPDDRERVLRAMERIRTTGEDELIEYRVLAKDGRTVWLRDGGTVIRDEHGEPAFIHGYLLDITEQKRSEQERSALEEQLRQAAKMEAVGRLAGGIAHDFNNLLTAIQGYSELALARLASDDPQRRDIEEIQRASERAATLTRQLLAFGRRQPLQPQAVEINTVIRDMESMLQRLIGEDIQLVTDLDPALGTVRVDPGQIEQVLMNLAVNARDAMPEGGRLTITTRNEDVAPGAIPTDLLTRSGPYVVLAVSDTGHGMSADVRERVFEPFFTTKDAGLGTGLGLAIVYGIVRQNGGHIVVDSTPGSGSSFRISLPLDGAAAERPEEPAHVEHGSPAAETVLLVEDEDSVRNMVHRVLEQQGYSVLAAATGEEALTIAHEHIDDIDLVFTDVVMPGMTGGELVGQLRELRPDVEVIYMSGYAEGASRRGVLDPSTTYLQKPFTPTALTQVVRRVLERAA